MVARRSTSSNRLPPNNAYVVLAIIILALALLWLQENGSFENSALVTRLSVRSATNIANGPSSTTEVASYCGDTVCNGNESPATCLDDCPRNGPTIFQASAKTQYYNPPGSNLRGYHYSSRQCNDVYCSSVAQAVTNYDGNPTMPEAGQDIKAAVIQARDGYPLVIYQRDLSTSDETIVYHAGTGTTTVLPIAVFSSSTIDTTPIDAIALNPVTQKPVIVAPGKIALCGNASCSSGNVIVDIPEIGASPAVGVGEDGLPRIASFTPNGLVVTTCTASDCSTTHTATVDSSAVNDGDAELDVTHTYNLNFPIIAYSAKRFGGGYSHAPTFGVKAVRCLDEYCDTTTIATVTDDPEAVFRSMTPNEYGLPALVYGSFVIGSTVPRPVVFATCNTNMNCSTQRVIYNNTAASGVWANVDVKYYQHSDGHYYMVIANFDDATQDVLNYHVCSSANCQFDITTRAIPVKDGYQFFGAPTILP